MMLVGITKCLAHLNPPPYYLVDGQRAFVLNLIPDASARDMAHDEIDQLLAFTDMIDSHYVRMLKIGGNGRFTFEPFYKICIANIRLGENFYGNLPVQCNFTGEINGRHSARTEFSEEFVLAFDRFFKERFFSCFFPGRLSPFAFLCFFRFNLGFGFRTVRGRRFTAFGRHNDCGISIRTCDLRCPPENGPAICAKTTINGIFFSAFRTDHY